MTTSVTLSTIHRRAAVIVSFAAAAVLAGCASLAPVSPEQQVQKRATQYWQARIAGQLDQAYALSTPSYRKLRTLEQFRDKFGPGARFVSAEVLDVRCAPERCAVKMSLGVVPALLGLNIGTVPNYIDEAWVLEDGQWWHYQDL